MNEKKFFFLILLCTSQIELLQLAYTCPCVLCYSLCHGTFFLLSIQIKFLSILEGQIEM